VENLHKAADREIYQMRNMMQVVAAAYGEEHPIFRKMLAELEEEYETRNIIAPLSWDLTMKMKEY